MSGTSTPKVGAPPNSNQTLCRNILIHGYCKFADKGCAFRHSTESAPAGATASLGASSTGTPTVPVSLSAGSVMASNSNNNNPIPGAGIKISTPSSGTTTPTLAKKRLNVASPAFTPKGLASPSSSATSSLQQHQPTSVSQPQSPIQSTRSPEKRNITFNPQLHFNPDSPSASAGAHLADPAAATAALASQFASTDLSQSSLSGIPPPHAHAHAHAHAHTHAHSANPSHAPPPPMPDYGHYQTSAFPLQYHLYAPQLKHSRTARHEKSVHDLFLPSDVHEYLFRRNEAALQQMPVPGLPEQVHTYHSLVPLDTNIGDNLWTYKATSSVDGKLYCLRRLDNFQVIHEQAIQTVQLWKDIEHVNLVSVHEAFTTRAFGDHSLIFVYDYYPLSQPLAAALQKPPARKDNLDQEKQTWSYAVQLLAALRVVHSHGRALRKIDPRSVLVTGPNQIRIANAAMMDVLLFDSQTVQSEDLVQVGELLKELIAGFTASKRLTDFTEALINGSLDLHHAIKDIAPYALDVYAAALTKGDEMEWHLQRELENSRLVRLLCKIGYINERPEHARDPRWSETGDRYLIKLFRDYVFHQVDDQGHPIVDLAHVVSCLNKLDAGIKENLLLVSRDEQNCLIVSYSEIKQCVDSAFRELLRDAV